MRPVVGVDLSLTSTGIAWLPGSARKIQTKPGDWGSEDDRIAFIADRVVEVVDGEYWGEGNESGPVLVLVEGLSMASKGGQQFTRSGLHYLVRHRLRQMELADRVVMRVVPPNSLKKYTTNKGNAGKPEMVSAVTRGLGRIVTSDDMADALALVDFGCALLGQPGPLGDRPKYRVEVAAKFGLLV